MKLKNITGKFDTAVVLQNTKPAERRQEKFFLIGIEVTTTEEGYTSKCSALDLEEIGKHEDHANGNGTCLSPSYAGKRVKRGLFRTAQGSSIPLHRPIGILINADVNGALNILRKVIGNIFLKPFIEKVARLIPSRGYLCYPFKVCF